MAEFHRPLLRVMWGHPGWQGMLSLLKGCTWDTLIVFKITRQERSFQLLLSLKDAIWREQKLALTFLLGRENGAELNGVLSYFVG